MADTASRRTRYEPTQWWAIVRADGEVLEYLTQADLVAEAKPGDTFKRLYIQKRYQWRDEE